MDKLEELGWKKQIVYEPDSNDTKIDTLIYTKCANSMVDVRIEIDRFTVEFCSQHWNKNKTSWYADLVVLNKDEMLALAEILTELGKEQDSGSYE